ncbi:MAG TPA: SPOR domain-containing protein, partial [Methylovirgula sp.]
ANPGTQVADASNQGYGLTGTITAKKVKTLAVRPDGSVMPGDSGNTGDTGGGPPSMQMPDIANGNGAAPAPQGNAGANPDATQANAAPTNVADQQPGDGSNATGANDANNADNAPSPVRPHHVKPTRVADLDTSGASEDTHSGNGDFAVQLAAPGSEAEAHRVMTKIAQEYQAELGDQQVKFRHVKVGDKSIYRVRVGGLSKSEATQLCGALQAKGGTCFVAKD